MYWEKLKNITFDENARIKNIDNNFIIRFDDFLRENTTEKERMKLDPIYIARGLDISEEIIMTFFKIAKKVKLLKPKFYYCCSCGEQFEIEILYDNKPRISLKECEKGCDINYEDNKDKIFVYFELLEDIEELENENDEYIYQVDYIVDEYEDEYTNNIQDYEKVIGEEGVSELIKKSIENIEDNIEDNIVKIVHVSDLHFGSQHSSRVDNKDGIKNIESIASKPFNNFIKSINKIRYDYLLISGDLTSQNESDGLEEFEENMKKSGIDKKKVYIVPGNHECDRSKSTEKSQFSLFNTYTEGFCTPFSKDKPYILDKENKIFIYGFNTVHFNKQENKELFYIEDKAFEKLDNIIEELNNVEDEFENYTKIAIQHNNLFPHPTIEIKEYSEMLNIFKVKYTLIKYGFSIVLSGHKHEGFVEKHSIYNKGNEKSIILISAPSLGGKMDNSKNGFQIININMDSKKYLDNIEIEKYDIDSMDEFEKVDTIKISCKR